jgi:hypothetical protein
VSQFLGYTLIGVKYTYPVRICNLHCQITGRLYADAQFPTSATERTVILTSGVGWASATPGQPYNIAITSATSGVISTTFNFEPGIGTQTAKIEVWRAGETDYSDTGLRVPSSTTYTGIFELTGIPTSGLTQIRITPINSAGVLKRGEEIKLTIPASIESGEMIRLSGRGEAVSVGVPGDLYVRVHVEKHPLFRREGADLVMDLPIKLSDSLLGSEYAVASLDGETKVQIPAGVTYGEMLRVRGRGVGARGGKRGDLLIRVLIKTPTKLSKKAKDLVDELRKEGL